MYLRLPSGELKTVADKNTPDPSGGGNFTGFTPGVSANSSGLSVHGDTVLFTALWATGQVGLYKKQPADGDPTDISLIADLNTTVPPDHTDTFTDLLFPKLEGNVFLFKGFGSGGDVPCAVETQRRLGSRLRNHR